MCLILPGMLSFSGRERCWRVEFGVSSWLRLFGKGSLCEGTVPDDCIGALCFALRLPVLEQLQQAPPVSAKPVDLQDKRKAHYQANSAEVLPRQLLLEFYPASSEGPSGAFELLKRDGRSWRKI